MFGTGFIMMMSIYTLLFALFIFLFCFANADDDDDTSISATIARFFLKKLPTVFYSCILKLFGEDSALRLYGVWRYVAYERNPLLLLLYLFIINSAFISWLIFGVQLLPKDSIHYYVAFIGVFLAQLTFYFACTVPPGRITEETAHCFGHEEFDGVLYVSKMYCRTCLVPKVARSKHCTLCGFCVPTFDHHCVWVNQCVGELNYRYFLLFLVTNFSFFFYATYVLSFIIAYEVNRRELFNVTFVDRSTGQEYRADFWIIAQYVLIQYLAVIILLLLALVMGLAVFAFFLYHVYLIAIGTTTNESFKWDSFKRIYRQIEGKYALIQKLKVEEKELEKEVAKEIPIENENIEQKRDETPRHPDKNQDKLTKSTKEMMKNADTVVGNSQRLSEKPVPPADFVFNEPPGYCTHKLRVLVDRLEEQQKAETDESTESPQRIKMKELVDLFPKDFPTNIYRVGLFPNLMKIFFPRSIPKLKDAANIRKKGE